MLETLLLILTILLLLITVILSVLTVSLIRPKMKTTTQPHNHSARIFHEGTDSSTSEGSAGVSFKATAIIGEQKHGNVPLEVQQALNEQAKEEAVKKAKIEAEELQKTVIAHTERYNNAIAETMDEIMYGPRKVEPAKKEG